MSALSNARICALCLLISSTACVDACAPLWLPELGDDTDEPSSREPFVDDWDTVWVAPAAPLELLSIGDRLAFDNFANRGDIELRYAEGTEEIVVEMQRFTVASSPEAAEQAFARMEVWAYDLLIPEQPREDIDDRRCEVTDTGVCYVRAYYDGLFQPLRDGANFRVTVPQGWDGVVELTTSDNLEEGVDVYPDRSDVHVDGLAGSLSVDMDSGRLSVILDPEIDHYAGCPASDACEQLGHAEDCGCDEPTQIRAETRGGAANMRVDLGDADGWFSVALENGDLGLCTATIDCEPFSSCELDSELAAVAGIERAEINYPGAPATPGAGIQIALTSDRCAKISYVDGPEDYASELLPQERRGDLEVCVGCILATGA